MRLAVAVVAPALVLVAAPARAQQHVCPNGAGPGETFVGMAPGGPGVAPAPLCNWVGHAPAAAPKPPRDPNYWGDPNYKTKLPKGWGASVDGIDKPVVANVRGKASRKEAIAAAMAECRRQGATRCELVVATEVR